MNTKIVTFIGLIGVGAVLGATLRGTDNTNQPSLKPVLTSADSAPASTVGEFTPVVETSSDKIGMQDIQNALTGLQKQLQQEIEKRKQLEKKVARLEKNIKSDSSNNNEQSSSASDSAIENAPNPHQPDSSGQRNWFNQQAMLDAGVDPGKVNYIKDTFEQAEMDRLYLQDQATREGWINSERYTKELQEINNRTADLRNQLNEKEFDSYLYAAGLPNRVLVQSVLSTSPANNAGIQAGDTILKYDNKRVFNWSDLTGATRGGNPNETVSVTVERDGQTQQLYMPRGPMGIRLTTDSVAP